MMQPSKLLPLQSRSASESRRSHRSLLALPVLFKVLITNSVVILVGATLGTYLATRIHQPNGPAILIGFITAGWLISVLINFVLLKIAFHPLTQLRETMQRIQAGSPELRAPLTGQDPEADQLAEAFNTMLETLAEAARSRATQILTAQEQERKRIARELHDETSQVLTSLLISLKVLEEGLASAEARVRVEETRSLVHQTLRAIRNLSIDLRPSALDDLGLLPALRWYIKEYQQKCQIEVEFVATNFKERLPSELETSLYRIVQEALTNTAKYAKATRVRISVVEEQGSVSATICDNGQGFDAQTILKLPWQERGLGLAGMHERAALLDGSLIITTEPGGGTTIEARLPLTRAATDDSADTMAHLLNGAKHTVSASLQVNSGQETRD
ncbi:MAG TPA: ATP-binding protein [Ktedonobacterales bacterium]|jgi:two-component system sensor histidine kinase UhpB